MAAEKVLTFQQALTKSDGTHRHVLLGNGFSIALRADIFTYGALYDHADFSGIPYAEQLFDALNTRDFEALIKVLRDAAKVLAHYGAGAEMLGQLERDAEALKNILVQAIAGRHPDRPFAISEAQYGACRRFLANFEHIYTMNYDVLLYWAIMQDELDELDLLHKDGFRAPEDEPDAPYVTWQDAHAATVHFLHGALHLFDAGHELQKYSWKRTGGVAIIDQVRRALDEERYPLFVSEGDSQSKIARIMHHAYLAKGLRSLEAVGGSLFIFGHSLAENDAHILQTIEGGKVNRLFVSLYGDPGSTDNRRIVRRANEMADRRKAEFRGKRSLSVEFYDAASAAVWG